MIGRFLKAIEATCAAAGRALKGGAPLRRRFARAEGGNMLALYAVSLVPVTAFAGVAVDVSRLSSAHSRLAQATDATALAIARNGIFNSAEAWPIAENYFSANYPKATFGDAAIADIDMKSDRVEVTSEATIKTLILGIISQNSANISVTSQVRRPVGGIEVAMVLDNTGSMGGNNKIKDLRKAAKDLTEFLFDNIEDPTGQVKDPLKIALVPFVTTVNIRTPDVFQWDWIDTNAEADYHGVNFIHVEDGEVMPTRRVNHLDLFRSTDTDWAGCVEMRPSSNDPNLTETIDYDVSDLPPINAAPNSKWVPYFWPDEPDCNNGACNGSPLLTSVPKEKEYHNRDYIKDKEFTKDNSDKDEYFEYIEAIKEPDDDDDDDDGGSLESLAALKAIPEYQLRQRYVGHYNAAQQKYEGKLELNPKIDESGGTTAGPNKSCPRPIVELTTDEKRLLTEIQKMEAIGGGGTNIAAGLSWGWRVLSPSSPYTQGAGKNSPIAKYMVLLTDGENWIWGGWKSHNKSNYSGYGYLIEERLGKNINTKNTAKNKINDKVEDLCDAITDDGIILYTVTFQVGGSVKSIFEDCANDSGGNYYDVKKGESLSDTFLEIALSLSNLRISK